MSELSSEDLARADHYAVLSRLFSAPPDSQFLAALAAAGYATQEGVLPAAWNELCQVAAEFTADRVREEYAALFVGVGKPLVVLYGSWHLTGFMIEKPLAQLRTDLAALGLARSRDVLESEDHFAALMDVMRHLILNQERDEAERLALQQRFFTDHIASWYSNLCNAIDSRPEAHFYRSVSYLARTFLEIEKMFL